MILTLSSEHVEQDLHSLACGHSSASRVRTGISTASAAAATSDSGFEGLAYCSRTSARARTDICGATLLVVRQSLLWAQWSERAWEAVLVSAEAGDFGAPEVASDSFLMQRLDRRPAAQFRF